MSDEAPKTAEQLSIRSETLFEFSGRIREGADTINAFASQGSVAALISTLLNYAAQDAATAAAKLRAAERASGGAGMSDPRIEPVSRLLATWQKDQSNWEYYEADAKRVLRAADAVDVLRAGAGNPTGQPGEQPIAEYKRLMHMVETYENTREPLCPRCHWPWRELPICANPGFDHEETCARYRHSLDVCAECEAEMTAEELQ